jgi:hypothetical protein
MGRHALVDRIAGKSCNLTPSGISLRTLHLAVVFRDHRVSDARKETAASLPVLGGNIYWRVLVNEVHLSMRDSECNGLVSTTVDDIAFGTG